MAIAKSPDPSVHFSGLIFKAYFQRCVTFVGRRCEIRQGTGAFLFAFSFLVKFAFSLGRCFTLAFHYLFSFPFTRNFTFALYCWLAFAFALTFAFPFICFVRKAVKYNVVNIPTRISLGIVCGAHHPSQLYLIVSIGIGSNIIDTFSPFQISDGSSVRICPDGDPCRAVVIADLNSCFIVAPFFNT